jgi:hypothetical protein
MVGRTVGAMACLVALACVSVVARAGAAQADQPPAFCNAGMTDDTPKPLPAQLVARARRVFELNMPDGLIQKTTVYRCMDGKTLLCATGANLACGKANVSRDPPGVTAWCRDHKQSDSIPMFVTGHDTINRWRCSGGRPLIDAPAEAVDARGFIARNWKDTGPP